jgi:putative FmdB family regulatory protein
MPLYVYKCPQGHTEDIMLRLSDLETPVYCLKCGQKQERQPTSAALSFKGSGWTPKHY